MYLLRCVTILALSASSGTQDLRRLSNRRYDMDLRDERELAFQRLLCICQSGLVSITDFR